MNVLTQDPILIDSTMLKPWRASVVDSLATITCTRKVLQVPILVRKILWSGVAADGDVLTITDGVGVTLITLTGTVGVPQTVVFCPLVCWSDFQITLSSGRVSIFTGGRIGQDESTETEDSAFSLLVQEASRQHFLAARCHFCKLKSWISRA